MRSTAFTLLLIVLAVLVCGLAGWAIKHGNLDVLTGAPPTQVGQRLYGGFTPDEVERIQVTSNGINLDFSKTSNGWMSKTPWKDRVDHRAALGIIQFTLGMQVEDAASADDIKLKRSGLREGSIHVRLTHQSGRTLAKYALGIRTPWLATVEGEEKPIPTVFVRPRDEGRNDFVYACTGDINLLFKDGLKFLRDYHPFYFNPAVLQKIRIRTSQGELTLSRETPQAAWRVIKPLDLGTNRAMIKTLLEGLYELQAVKVVNRSETTLPGDGTAVKTSQIAIVPFGSTQETVLELFPPETPASREVKAVVSDRPDTVFELPAKAEPGFVSVADLPLTVNELRDARLTNLNIQSLRAISIEPSTGTPILISRTPPQPWMATIQGRSEPANEERLFALLKAVTDGKVTGFETDAATDFTPWGLDRPFLKLRFLGEGDQVLELNFGLDARGGMFVNRLGTSSVMRVDAALVSTITVRPYEWRHARLWSLDRTRLMEIVRTAGNEEPLALRYDFINEGWQARMNDEDVSSRIDPARANFMLTSLEGLEVSRWLSTDDERALTALANPTFKLAVTEKIVDENGDFQGLQRRELEFAPISADPNPPLYYGRLSTDPYPFLLERDAFRKIAGPVLEQE